MASDQYLQWPCLLFPRQILFSEVRELSELRFVSCKLVQEYHSEEGSRVGKEDYINGGFFIASGTSWRYFNLNHVTKSLQKCRTTHGIHIVQVGQNMTKPLVTSSARSLST